MFLLLMTSPLNLNCLKFNNQSSLFFSLFLTYHLLISTIKPTSYLYLSLNSSSFSSQKKKKNHIVFPPNKLLIFLLLMTSPLNLNCLKFNNQSFLFLSLFLTYHLLISIIKPTSYLYISLSTHHLPLFKKKKIKKTHHLPTKQVANISPINDFTIKSQLP